MKNIPKIIPVMYAKALKDGTLVWGEDCVSATNDFEEDGFTGVALVRLSDVDACQTNEQGRAADGAVSDEQVDAAMEGFHFTATGLPRRADMRCALEQFAATQPPSAIPVAVPEATQEQIEALDDLVTMVRRLVHSLNLASPTNALVDSAVDYLQRKGFNKGPFRSATPSNLPDAGLDSQRLKFLVEKADWHRKGTGGHWTIRLYNKRHTTFLQTVDAANATSKATS